MSFGVNGAHYKTILTKVPEGTGSDKLNGMWEANPDGWTAAGTGTISNGAFYLRGVGKPYYNVYQYLYGGVDQATGLPLISSTVTSENIEALRASHYVGDLKEGNMVYTTNHSLATRQEIGDATPKLIGGFNTSFPLERPPTSRLLSHSRSAVNSSAIAMRCITTMIRPPAIWFRKI